VQARRMGACGRCQKMADALEIAPSASQKGTMRQHFCRSKAEPRVIGQKLGKLAAR
jgi:hypothetical protein